MAHDTLARCALGLALWSVGCAPGLIGEDVPLDLDPMVIPGDANAHAAAAALELAGAALPAITVQTDHAAIDAGPANYLLLRSASAEITSPGDGSSGAGCWDFVRAVAVYIESAEQGSTLPRVEIAHASAPGCVRGLDLVPDDGVNLRPYTSGAFRLTLDTTGIPPAVDVTFATHLVVRAAVL